MSVYANPASDGGRLADIHLSALGGYGTQRALFAAKTSAIETETTQGRTHRYKLERIGRIGALWHRAKHVIIYERTVVPSAQFFNRPPIGLGQDEHRGRPILRKVEEYVEILQPARRYPEDGTSVAAAGCLIGAEFKSRRIRVDSRWGEDVRREGWRVPLWNRAFATSPASGPESALNPDDPSLIYPKPQISFVLAGEGGAEIRCEVDEPEKLCFYTSVVKGESGDDTDSWRPVRDVDFVDLPLPRVGRVTPCSDRLTDAILPAEPAHVPGYEQFTIGLVRSGEAAQLTHGLLPDGPAALLKSLTIARVMPGAVSSSAMAQVGEALADSAADLRAAADGALGGVLGALEHLDPVKDAGNLKDLAKQRLRAALGSGRLTGDIRAKAAEIRKGLGTLGRSDAQAAPGAAIEHEVRGLVASQTERLRAVGNNVQEAAADEAMSVVAALADEARAPLGATETEWNARAERLLALRERLYAVFDAARDSVALVRAATKADLNALQRLAGSGLGDAEGDLSQALGQAIAALQSLIGQGSEQNKQAALARLRAARETLAAVMARFAAGDAPAAARRIAAAADVALAAAISEVSLGLAGLQQALRTLEALSAAIKERASALSDTGQGAVAQLREALQDVIDRGLEAADDIIDGVQEVVETEPADDTGDTLLDLLDAAIEVIAGVPGQDDPEDAGPAIQASLDRIDDLIGKIETKVRDAIRRMAGILVGDLDRASHMIDQRVDELVRALASSCAALEGFALPMLQDPAVLGDRLEQLLDLEDYEQKLGTTLETAVERADAQLDEIKRQVSAAAEQIGRQVENRARQFAGSVQESIRDQIGMDPVLLDDRARRAYQQGGNTLRLLRAVGDPPKTDGLGLNRPAVAYVASQVGKVIDVTPAIVLVNRVADTTAALNQAGAAVGDLLQSFGVRLPTGRLTDQFLPDKLRNLSLPDLLPDMAGLDFRGLLRGVGFPDLDDANAIRITRGFDEGKQLAWLSADIAVPLTTPATLLSFGPVEIVIDGARFVARARIVATPAGVKKSMHGHISGDWRVVTAGQDVLIFRRTGLHFDDTGHIDFKIDPERVELAPALEFLTNFLVAAGKGDGLVVEPLVRGAVPVGVAASLSTRLPDL